MSLAKANDTLDSLTRDEGTAAEVERGHAERMHRQTGRCGDQGFDEAG